MQPSPPPPDGKKGFTWPIAVNLSLLLLTALFTEADPSALGIGVLVLVVINSLAAGIMAFSGRIHYVVAFILSALVVGLIGFGACVLMLSNMGGGH